MTFVLGCHDREAISWAATTGGHSGDVVRDVMLAVVEKRFGTAQASALIEWLSDNGSAYIDHRTRSFARELGFEPLTTHVRSPQSNGMAAKVQTVLERDPFSGHVFLFRGRRGDLVKVLWWSGDGMCLLMKRLERGRFVWPRADGGVVCLSQAQLSMLLEGIDWRQPVRTTEPTSAL